MTTTEVQCPKCHGGMWDNRATKRNPKQPDFKCKDKSCDGVIWPPKGGSPYAAPAAPASNAKQPFSAGGPLPWEDRPVAPIATPEYGDVAAQQQAVDALRSTKLDSLFTLYRTCLNEAVDASKKLPNATPEAIAAMTATLFIQANQRGLAA